MQIRLISSDLGRAERFYVEGLRLDILGRQTRDGTLTAVTLAGRGTLLELVADVDEARWLAVEAPRRGGCPLELVFQSDDARFEVERLVACGGKLAFDVRRATPTELETGVRDPDGFVIVLRQTLADQGVACV